MHALSILISDEKHVEKKTLCCGCRHANLAFKRISFNENSIKRRFNEVSILIRSRSVKVN